MVCVHVGDNVLWVVFDGVGIVVVISIGRPATDVERGCMGALVVKVLFENEGSRLACYDISLLCVKKAQYNASIKIRVYEIEFESKFFSHGKHSQNHICKCFLACQDQKWHKFKW